MSIAIMDVECTAASCQDTSTPRGGFAGIAAIFAGAGGVKGIGGGVKSMFSNAINETKCFKIVDLAKIEKMRQMMAATGQTVTPPKIDVIVNTSITAIDVSKDGGALLGGVVPIVGLISSNTSKANIAVDMSTMNPTTMEVGESKSFKANSEKTSWGFGGAAGVAGGGWSVTKNVALDNVIRDVIFSATNYLTDTYAKEKIITRAPVAVKD
jgi:curli biogenesis system outer membrane secretion channel CsgG